MFSQNVELYLALVLFQARHVRFWKNVFISQVSLEFFSLFWSRRVNFLKSSFTISFPSARYIKNRWKRLTRILSKISFIDFHLLQTCLHNCVVYFVLKFWQNRTVLITKEKLNWILKRIFKIKMYYCWCDYLLY